MNPPPAERPQAIDSDIQKTALRFLDAYRFGEGPAMQSMTGCSSIDPFLLAHAMLRVLAVSCR